MGFKSPLSSYKRAGSTWRWVGFLPPHHYTTEKCSSLSWSGENSPKGPTSSLSLQSIQNQCVQSLLIGFCCSCALRTTWGPSQEGQESLAILTFRSGISDVSEQSGLSQTNLVTNDGATHRLPEPVVGYKSVMEPPLVRSSLQCFIHSTLWHKLQPHSS